MRSDFFLLLRVDDAERLSEMKTTKRRQTAALISSKASALHATSRSELKFQISPRAASHTRKFAKFTKFKFIFISTAFYLFQLAHTLRVLRFFLIFYYFVLRKNFSFTFRFYFYIRIRNAHNLMRLRKNLCFCDARSRRRVAREWRGVSCEISYKVSSKVGGKKVRPDNAARKSEVIGQRELNDRQFHVDSYQLRITREFYCRSLGSDMQLLSKEVYTRKTRLISSCDCVAGLLALGLC